MRLYKCGIVLVCLAFTASAWAQDAVVAGLGQATLAIEEDNTRLNLFNLGNPAGAAFLPQKNRLDLTLDIEERERVAEFATGADGSPANVAPNGNTLTPASIYTRQTRNLMAGLNQNLAGGYGGALLSLNDAVTLQINPTGTWQQQAATDAGNSYRQQSGGGKVRAAWLLDPHWSVGAGVSGSSAWEQGLQEPDWTSLNQITDFPYTASLYTPLNRTESQFGAEVGGVWRTESLFDAKDFLDLGLLAQGQRQTEHTVFQETLTGTSAKNAVYDGQTLPWQAHVQGVYSYESVMELALVAGYQNQQWFHALDVDGLPGESDHVSMNLDNVDYELSFRVRLPMVRNDDLRFGVVFNNRGLDHPYPTGRLLVLGADGLYSKPTIETVSSSIGIGVAFVPAEHSIVTMEYHLGSSKTHEDQPSGSLPGSEIIANSGFTLVDFGAQYSLIENLVLRFGFSSLRVAYQTPGTTLDPNTSKAVLVTTATQTAGVSFGLGLDEGPFTFNLTVKGERLLNSPPGWTMLDKPTYTGDATQDVDQNLTTYLGVTWKMP